MEMRFTDKDSLYLMIKDGKTEAWNGENYDVWIAWDGFHRFKFTATEFFTALFDESCYDIYRMNLEWGRVCLKLMNKHSLHDEYDKDKRCSFQVKYDQEGKPFISMDAHTFERSEDGEVKAYFTSRETVDYTYEQLIALPNSDREKGDE